MFPAHASDSLSKTVLRREGTRKNNTGILGTERWCYKERKDTCRGQIVGEKRKYTFCRFVNKGNLWKKLTSSSRDSKHDKTNDTHGHLLTFWHLDLVYPPVSRPFFQQFKTICGLSLVGVANVCLDRLIFVGKLSTCIVCLISEYYNKCSFP